jgi:hypothetical protein
MLDLGERLADLVKERLQYDVVQVVMLIVFPIACLLGIRYGKRRPSPVVRTT